MSEITEMDVTSPHHTHRGSHSNWFTAQIQQMMHGLGDCRRPLVESAALIEEIVHQQLHRLLYQAEEVARQRSARFISMEDFIFLLRKDKVKLRRFIRFMELKDVKSWELKGMEDEEGVEDVKSNMRKRRKICYDFISSIDQTGELLALFEDTGEDEAKTERALRAELLSRTLDVQQYKDYCTARQASFAPKFRSQRFKEWLLSGAVVDIKPNPLAIECFTYMAYETVAQIVDLSLLVQRDLRASTDNPLSRHLPPVLCSHDKSEQSGGGVKPPASVKTLTSPQSHESSQDLLSLAPITPQHIHEAVRRFHHNTGPFADFSKQPLVSARQRLFCV